jgi:membrane dipeptidase
VIVDAHCDLLLEVVIRQGKGESPELVLRRGRERLLDGYWLPRLEAGGVGVQICPIYAATAPAGETLEWALAQEAEFARAVAENADRVCQVRTRSELDDSRVRLMLAFEGLEPLQGDPGAFEDWYRRGVRMASLTWNHSNEFAGGLDTQAQGLTEQGRTLVRRFGELGVVLDLAHASEQTWRDVLEADVPFTVTHAGCRAIVDTPRNLADWQLEALAECGGVLGMMAMAFVVDPQSPTLSRWLDHVDHAVAVMGIEHVGLGADFVEQAWHPETPPTAKRRLELEGFTGPEEYPALVTALRQRGYDGDELEAIMSGNWLRILRATLPA